VLPDWFRPAGRGWAPGREPGKHRRDYAPASFQRNCHLACHAHPGTDHPDRGAACHCDGHPNPNVDGNPNNHACANPVCDRNGEPDPDSRCDAVCDSISDSHAPSDADRNPDSKRHGPGSNQHATPDCNHSAADSDDAATHRHATAAYAHIAPAHPDNSADETSTGVDLAS